MGVHLWGSGRTWWGCDRGVRVFLLWHVRWGGRFCFTAVCKTPSKALTVPSGLRKSRPTGHSLVASVANFPAKHPVFYRVVFRGVDNKKKNVVSLSCSFGVGELRPGDRPASGLLWGRPRSCDGASPSLPGSRKVLTVPGD